MTINATKIVYKYSSLLLILNIYSNFFSFIVNLWLIMVENRKHFQLFEKYSSYNARFHLFVRWMRLDYLAAAFRLIKFLVSPTTRTNWQIQNWFDIICKMKHRRSGIQVTMNDANVLPTTRTCTAAHAHLILYTKPSSIFISISSFNGEN